MERKEGHGGEGCGCDEPKDISEIGIGSFCHVKKHFTGHRGADKLLNEAGAVLAFMVCFRRPILVQLGIEVGACSKTDELK